MARKTRIFYAPNGAATLAQAIAQHNDPNTDYYISVNNPAAHKNLLRTLQAYHQYEKAPNIHALVEFNLGAWRKLPGTWFEKGVQFRRMMAQSGLGNEKWAINEAGSGIRDANPAARRHLANLVRGLYRGGGAYPRTAGVIFQQGPGYDQGLQHWQGDRKFWRTLKNRVSYYMNETYTSPQAWNAWQQQRQVHYLMGGAEGIGARHPLNQLYAPMMSAFWGKQGPYGNTQIPLADMQKFIQAQSQVLQHSGKSTYGFAWNEHPQAPDMQNLPALATSLVAL